MNKLMLIRVYSSDFPSEAETMDRMCLYLKKKERDLLTVLKDIAALYEARLAKENPHAGQVQYR